MRTLHLADEDAMRFVRSFTINFLFFPESPLLAQLILIGRREVELSISHHFNAFIYFPTSLSFDVHNYVRAFLPSHFPPMCVQQPKHANMVCISQV